MSENNRSVEYFTDSVGNKLIEGDLVRCFHFTGSRMKKHYMYKIVQNYELSAKGILFLTFKDVHSDHTYRIKEGATASAHLRNMVLVSREKFHNNELDNIKRNKSLRD